MSFFLDILDDEFLTLVADDIGDEWRSLIINLGFESSKLAHFAYKKDELLDIILDGLHTWKEIPLIDAHLTSACIIEIRDLIIAGLKSNECNDIADEILSTFYSSGKI